MPASTDSRQAEIDRVEALVISVLSASDIAAALDELDARDQARVRWILKHITKEDE